MGAESSSMANGAAHTCAAGCKNLGSKQTDTVKVDLEKLLERAPARAGKENSDPGRIMEENTAQQRAEELAKERQQRAEEMQRAAEWRMKKAEEDARQARERELQQRQRELEEEVEQARRAVAEEKARQAEEMRQLEIAKQRAEEQLRQRAEEQARQQKMEEEERRRRFEEAEEAEEQERAARNAAKEAAEDARKNEKLQQFLGKVGFKAATEKKVKKSMLSSSFSYPLHAAAEAKDAEAVELLLWAGADRATQNSKRQTPMQLAEAKNKKGSHARVIAALAA